MFSQIGSATYSTTKHAAVGFAEWLSITYGDHGVGVSCLCPMGVETALLAPDREVGDEEALMLHTVRSAGAVLTLEAVAIATLDAVADGGSSCCRTQRSSTCTAGRARTMTDGSAGCADLNVRCGNL